MTKVPEGKKSFNITLPTTVYGEFYKLLPEQGERTAFLRNVITTAIMLGRKEKLATKVAEIIHKETYHDKFSHGK